MPRGVDELLSEACEIFVCKSRHTFGMDDPVVVWQSVVVHGLTEGYVQGQARV
jgi:hypothetical protein